VTDPEGTDLKGADPEGTDRTAARLVRWYPAAWRSRYGEEFSELLLADIAERPRSWRRACDVARSGLLARLAGLGLTSHALNPADQIRASLAMLGCAVAAFLVFGVAMLAQLAIGWQWASPHAAATTSGTLLMAVGAGGIALLALLGGAPLVWCAAAGLMRQRSGKIGWPAGLVVAGGGALWIGAHHFQNAWPGTGGTAAHRDLVPGGAAAFGWASTLSVSSYWAHPAALHRFPVPELAWMLASPIALLCLAGGAAAILRRLRMSPRMIAYQARLAVAAPVILCCFFAGAACWVFGAGSASAGLFHAGAVDVTGLAVMTAALVIAVRAAASACCASLALAGQSRKSG
jgi:hypothetical protein